MPLLCLGTSYSLRPLGLKFIDPIVHVYNYYVKASCHVITSLILSKSGFDQCMTDTWMDRQTNKKYSRRPCLI